MTPNPSECLPFEATSRVLNMALLREVQATEENLDREPPKMEILEARIIEIMEHRVGVNTQKNFPSPLFYKMSAALDLFGWKSLKAPIAPSQSIWRTV